MVQDLQRAPAKLAAADPKGFVAELVGILDALDDVLDALDDVDPAPMYVNQDTYLPMDVGRPPTS